MTNTKRLAFALASLEGRPTPVAHVGPEYRGLLPELADLGYVRISDLVRVTVAGSAAADAFRDAGLIGPRWMRVF